jgi:probable F420-dependent oxidoreductase
MEAARKAEAWGYDSVWAAERLIIPWEIKTEYPYSADQHFIVPPDRPFLEPLTCLAFLTGCTEKVLIGSSVTVLPYRHPLYTAKVATSIDTLSNGRFILGVGIGWMVEEFEALGVPFHERAAMSDEQLQIIKLAWTEDRVCFEGRYYRFDDVAVYPKPVQKPRIPIWVGGEGARAQRRAALHGDAWFPYFVRITPQELKTRFDNVRRWAAESGRDPAEIRLACCLPIELRREPVPQEEGRLIGNSEQLTEALKGYQEIGVEHIALQFMVPRYPDRMEQIEQFAKDVMPALRDQRSPTAGLGP